MPSFLKPDPDFVKHMEEQPEYVEFLKSVAFQVKDVAEQLSPTKTHAYQRKFRVTVEGTEVRLGNFDPFAHLVEWGSRYNPPYAPIRRAVRAAGLGLREDPKQ